MSSLPQTQPNPYLKAYPLGLSLLDGDDNPAIYIPDNPLNPDENLHVTIRNSWQDPIYIQPSSNPKGEASKDNYHFQLGFRPGILSAATFKNLALDPIQGTGADWKISGPEKGVLWDTVYLLYTGSQALAIAGGTAGVQLTLQHVGADATGGSRGTHVQLSCNDAWVTYDSAGQVGIHEESRYKLNVVNHRGKKHLPMHVDFAGSTGSKILNNGSEGSLLLRLTNVSPKKDASDGALVMSQNAKVELSIDSDETGQEVWALGTSAQVQGIGVKIGKQTVAAKADDQTVTFTITAEMLGGEMQGGKWVDGTLARDKSIDIELSNIQTTHKMGPAPLRVTCSGMGYYDQTFVCQIEKTPLLTYKVVDQADSSRKATVVTTVEPPKGLTVVDDSLLYLAKGGYSWRDEKGQERMVLTVGNRGGLAVHGIGTSTIGGPLEVKGTAASTFAGPLQVNGTTASTFAGPLTVTSTKNSTLAGSLTIKNQLAIHNDANTAGLLLSSTNGRWGIYAEEGAVEVGGAGGVSIQNGMITAGVDTIIFNNKLSVNSKGQIGLAKYNDKDSSYNLEFAMFVRRYSGMTQVSTSTNMANQPVTNWVDLDTKMSTVDYTAVIAGFQIDGDIEEDNQRAALLGIHMLKSGNTWHISGHMYNNGKSPTWYVDVLFMSTQFLLDLRYK